MAILIKKGEVKAGNKYYAKGDVLDGLLSKQEEKWLISQGFAEEVDVGDAADIGKMTEKELKEFAKLNGIDIAGVKGKANILAKITEAIQSQDDESGGDDDGDTDDEEQGDGGDA